MNEVRVSEDDSEADLEAGAEAAAGESHRYAGGITVDCDSCLFRARECDNCVVSVVVEAASPLCFGSEELRAVSLLADAGMVPPLRYAAV
ncbi:hypothetical protein ACWGRK_10720 [Saccharomonospora azurea]|jgi:hypothetical protein|uniref:hypothetical protein n=1 Tax=Saccharomonospora azurea TaxID=40988 RepID=UPI0002400DD0|nr:hypothetical protein [Saccharomonospora azurea]EHK85059.1 hypothetical protein SZMC14600_17038 [Saccharomonospora azurea SZMC 14600]